MSYECHHHLCVVPCFSCELPAPFVGHPTNLHQRLEEQGLGLS
jgi:hypothetical protein